MAEVYMDDEGVSYRVGYIMRLGRWRQSSKRFVSVEDAKNYAESLFKGKKSPAPFGL